VVKSRNSQILTSPNTVLLLIIILWGVCTACAARPGWKRQDVNWRLPGGLRVRAISYPQEKPPLMLSKRAGPKPVRLVEKSVPSSRPASPQMATGQATTTVLVNVIDSPPIDGTVPWVAVAVTDERSYELYDADAYTEYSVVGNYLTANPASDYAIGIFDTGSSAHIISVYDAIAAGIYDANLVTSYTVTLGGATADANAFVSHPLAFFTDGLAAIDPNTLLVDDSNMVGQSNVAIIVGDIVESPNLPTVVGSPLAFFFTTVIENSELVSLTVNDNEITAPNVRFYQHDNNDIPDYSNKIFLELRPTTAYAVQFLPCFESLGEVCPDGDGEPTTPSVVFGSLLDVPQSLFFTDRTDLAHGNRTSQQKKFMFDTGAQITIVSESQAAELELLAYDPNGNLISDFEVEIIDVTGQSTIAPGYYIDLLEISATPQWLGFTNVPVVVLDVDSPEGGILEGIIGMNLFVDIDFYLRGGGLYLQDQPYLMFEFLPPGLNGDIAPVGGDGFVNLLDLAAFTQAWLATPISPEWNSKADMVSDAIIDFRDFARLAENWLKSAAP